MKTITIQIFYTGPAGNALRQGDFPVNQKAYAEDEFSEAARIAKNFWDDIQRDSGYRSSLRKIIYNAEHNITNLLPQDINPWDIM